MLTQEIIRIKRDGAALDATAIARFVAGITDGGVADEQPGAFAMAVFINGMNQVLARNAGNALEVAEAIEILRGERTSGRLLDVTRELAAAMLLAGGLFDNREGALAELDRRLASGEAAERFQTMVARLGGPSDLLQRAPDWLPRAPEVMAVFPERPGYVASMDVYRIGMAVVELGGGRARGDPSIDPSVGLEALAGIGERVDGEHAIARIHARNRAEAERAAARILGAVELAEDRVEPPPLIHRTIGAARPAPTTTGGHAP